MKKCFMIILAFLMALGAVACKGGEESSESNSGKNSSPDLNNEYELPPVPF